MADERTSPRAAGAASRILKDPNASADAKTAAASALSQAEASERAVAAVAGAAVVEDQPVVTLRRFQFAPLDPPIDERGNERQQSPVVEIADGAYHRIFRVEEQPFEAVGISHVEGEGDHARTVYDVTPEDEARLLLRDGHFVEVTEEPGPQGSSLRSQGKIGGSPVPDGV